MSAKVPTVTGERPVHVHVCQYGDAGDHDKMHDWACNSPYCVSRVARCQDHEGLPPIPEGYEPWKGR